MAERPAEQRDSGPGARHVKLREQPAKRPAHRLNLVTIGVESARPRGPGEPIPIGLGSKVRNPDSAEVVSGERMHRVLLFAS